MKNLKAGLSALFLMLSVSVVSADDRQREVLFGFNQVVFGSEYSPGASETAYVRKFSTPVRFHIDDRARKNRLPAVRKFIENLENSIDGIRVSETATLKDANFSVIIVDKKDYANIVRNEVYRDPNQKVVGRCIVTSAFSRNGIRKSTAVILSDDGERVFRRCMIEEILQGLGPLNEHESLMKSVFNDKSRQSSFTQFDRLIMNMLYDPALSPGMSQSRAQRLLPQVYKRALEKVS